MPAPLANRFLHLEVEPDFDSFKAYSLSTGLPEQILAFLSFRPALLHHHDPQQPAWPSPRSWTMAGRLHTAGLEIAPVVGNGAAMEFKSYIQLYDSLPDLVAIIGGQGGDIGFPDEPSVRYATAIGLTLRGDEVLKAVHAFRWMADKAPGEWVQLFIADLFRLLRERAQLGPWAQIVMRDPRLQPFLREYQELLAQ
jgi:hypothetical protein